MNYLSTIRYPGLVDELVREHLTTLLDRLADRLETLTPAGITDWLARVRLETDGTPITPKPYQLAPLAAQLTGAAEQVTIIGPEQYGKSLTWKLAVLWKMVYHARGNKLIVYEEKAKAADINRRTFHPLLTQVPALARAYAASDAYTRRNAYELPGGATLDFTGAGADVTSQAYRDVVGDEIDTWPLTYAKRLAQIENLRKRRLTWAARNLGCLVLCSSCKGSEHDSAIWSEFLHSSRHYWTLRCQACGALTMRSDRIDGELDRATGTYYGGLKFAKSDTDQVVADSLRLECPACRHQHTPDQAATLAAAGEYVPERPEETRHLGFVFGGLADPALRSWARIAERRVAAARSAEYEVQRAYHNSVRGVAMPVRAVADDRRAALLGHSMPRPPDADIAAVLIAADTQENPWGWYWVARGIDRQLNRHLLAAGFVRSRKDLEAVLTGRYASHSPLFAIIDQGGTNAEDVKWLARHHGHVWQYKGDSRPAGLMRRSATRDQFKLILADAEKLQIMLLRDLYDQTDRANNFFALPPADEVPRSEDDQFDYLTHLANVRDLQKGAESHLRQNWDALTSERRDFFDCEKMLLVLLNMPLFRRRLDSEISKLPSVTAAGHSCPASPPDTPIATPATNRPTHHRHGRSGWLKSW